MIYLHLVVNTTKKIENYSILKKSNIESIMQRAISFYLTPNIQILNNNVK